MPSQEFINPKIKIGGNSFIIPEKKMATISTCSYALIQNFVRKPLSSLTDIYSKPYYWPCAFAWICECMCLCVSHTTLAFEILHSLEIWQRSQTRIAAQIGLNINKNVFQSKANCPLILILTLVLKLDLDMVLIYPYAKKKVSIPFASKVTARMDRQTQQKYYLCIRGR